MALLVFAFTRTTWSPVVPLRIARRRTWGQILRAAARMYVRRARLFLGLGLVLIPLGFVISFVQAVVIGGFGLAGVDTTGESAGGPRPARGDARYDARAARASVSSRQQPRVRSSSSTPNARSAPCRPSVSHSASCARFWEGSRSPWRSSRSPRDHGPRAGCTLARRALVSLGAGDRDRGSAGARGAPPEQPARRGRWLRVASLAVVGSGLALAAGPLLGALLISSRTRRSRS